MIQLSLHTHETVSIPPLIESINADVIQKNGIQADVLRLDKIHPVISGNKWYKLKKYLQEAKALNKRIIVTFGGAYSNHIIATAAACQQFHFESIGIIRGEQPHMLSHTLKEAQQHGMKLIFISRLAYSTKELPLALSEHCTHDDIYIIPEGGYGKKGMEGAQTMLSEWDSAVYTHICAAVGTGTMLSGLIQAAQPHQHVLGVSVLKNNMEIDRNMEQLLSYPSAKYEILHQYYFGGYAKYTSELIAFMNQWYHQTGIPTDFVYTAKLFYTIHSLVSEGYFKKDSRILVIHSGGLQGNRSLENNLLEF